MCKEILLPAAGGARAADGGGDTQPSALPGLPTPDPALHDQLIFFLPFQVQKKSPFCTVERIV